MAPTPNDFPRIYLFGDSLTERGFNESDCGFGWKLGQYYEDRVEVVNEGSLGLCDQLCSKSNETRFD